MQENQCCRTQLANTCLRHIKSLSFPYGCIGWGGGQRLLQRSIDISGKKIAPLRFTLQSLLASQSSTADSPPLLFLLPLPTSHLSKFSISPLKLKSHCS